MLYIPIQDPLGKLYELINFGANVFDSKSEDDKHNWQIAAIPRSLALLELDLDEAILTARRIGINLNATLLR
jgi:hypothetical protein